jgi:hypothetical protein
MATYSFGEDEPIVLKDLAFRALIALKDGGTRLRISRSRDRTEMRVWTPEGDCEFVPWPLEAVAALAELLAPAESKTRGDTKLLLTLQPYCLSLDYSFQLDDVDTVIDISLPTDDEERETAHAIFKTLRRRWPPSIRGDSETDFIRNMAYATTVEMEQASLHTLTASRYFQA